MIQDSTGSDGLPHQPNENDQEEKHLQWENRGPGEELTQRVIKVCVCVCACARARAHACVGQLAQTKEQTNPHAVLTVPEPI